MRSKTKLLVLLSTLVLTMCKTYANAPITYINGLSCQNYIDYRLFEGGEEGNNVYVREEGADCSYTCPDGSVEQTSISGSISAIYAYSKEDLDAQLCGIAAPTATEGPLVTDTPSSSRSPTPTSSPTLAASATIVPAVTQDPLLTELVTMCDLGGKLINFKLVEPVPDLDGRTLEVQIAGRESSCFVNPTNPSLLTCRIPIGVSFPADIVVSLDGVIVNQFEYNGLGCSILTTPTPGLRPSYP